MKKTLTRTLAALLSLALLFSVLQTAVFAAETAYGPYDYEQYAYTSGERERVKTAAASPFAKGFYNALNVVADGLLRVFSAVYPNPRSMEKLDNFDDTYYLPGRETYATEAAAGNFWSLGYASRSIIPDDFEPGKYYIGRDLTNRLAKGVNDDNRVRAVALDDNSGEGLVVFAAVDALGVTSADTLAVRKAVLAWAAENGVNVAALNLSATHSHSAIDAQGVATESIYKILTAGWKKRSAWVWRSSPSCARSSTRNPHARASTSAVAKRLW